MKSKKLTDKQKIELLAKSVKFAVSHLEGGGEIIDLKTGKSQGPWPYVFAKRLRECGFDCDDDAVEYARWPRSKRKGPAFKALVAKLKEKGYAMS